MEWKFPMSPRVSVIVPMYNVECYLDQCVRSLFAQTLKDIEIILVDDGSPDNCGQMAENYAKKDKRVKVVHRANGGLGPARNSGMEVASGEYIGFVDSDDWVEPQMYAELVAAADRTNADVCFSGIQLTVNGVKGDRTPNPFAGRLLIGQDEIFEMRRSFYGGIPDKNLWEPVPLSVWTAVYRREFIERHDIRFRAIRSEDKFFNTAVCRAASRVTAIGETRYNYRKDGQASITHTFSKNTVPSYLELFKELNNMASEEPEQYRDECILRTKRCVVDYSRVVSWVIAGSSRAYVDKRAAMRQLMDDSVVRKSLRGFPCHKLPIHQAILALLTRMRAVDVLLLTAGLLDRLRRLRNTPKPAAAA